MHISAYHRVNEFYSIADAEGEGSAWKLAVKNCDGSIEYIVERIGNEWFVDPNSRRSSCAPWSVQRRLTNDGDTTKALRSSTWEPFSGEPR